MRERKAVSGDPASADVAVFAEGVRRMKERSARDPLDPLGWQYQSRMHGNPRALPRAPGDPEDWSQCQHGTWFFLPWHRMYLVQLERIIRSETGEDDWALPYWDYPDPATLTIPAPFLDEASALFDGSRALRPPRPMAPDTWQRSGTFVAFGGGRSAQPAHRGEEPGALELSPHNPVHGRVGGNLATFQSPLDPLFWIHHANIDRLWAIWLTLPSRSNPEDVSWSDTGFEFPDPEGRRRLVVGDVASNPGYSYDDLTDPGLRLVAAGIVGAVASGPRKDDDLELLGATSTGGSVNDRAEIEVVRPALKRRRSIAGSAADASLPLFLRLENVGVESGDASSMWNVFVQAGGGERHLAGTIAPFGLAGLTASGGRQTITIDVSHLSEEVLGGDAAPLAVTFEAVYDDVEGEPFWERAALYTTAT